ncbi:MAG: hypothetical protein R2857_14350 [Vampirovibrionales bacterium]
MTFDKAQNIASGVLLGRSTAGSGSVETISPGSFLSMTGSNLDVSLPTADDTTAGVLETATATEQQRHRHGQDRDAGTAAAASVGCQGLISFTGTGTITINEDYGVASITDNGTGHYTITFDTAFAANHLCHGRPAYISANGLGTVFATSKATRQLHR